MKKCKVCKVEFMPVYPSQRQCSQACTMKKLAGKIGVKR